MRSRTSIRAALGLAVLALVPGAALAHGGCGYRDPGRVPPDSRAPSDPPPPPEEPAAAAKPSPWSDWRHWWSHRANSILTPGASRRGCCARGPAGELAPAESVRTRAAAPLRKLLAAPEESRDVRAAVLLALARARDAAIADDLRRILTADEATEPRVVRESAALAFGLLGDSAPGARGFLVDFVLGDRDDSFARPFAAISLGLLGDAPDGSVTEALLAVIARDEPGEDVKPACLLALGLLGGARAGDELVSIARFGRARAAGAAELGDVARSYAVTALGMIGESGARGEAFDAVDRLAGGAAGSEAVETRRSAAIALGLLAEKGGAAARRRATATLCDLADDGGAEDQARLFALDSLGRVGAAAGEDPYLRRITVEILGRTMRTGEGFAPSYAALSLGLVGRAICDEGGPAPERDVRVPLRNAFRDEPDLRRRGAFALASGLARDPFAVDALLAVLRDEHAERDLRGWCALALAMIFDLRAAGPIRETLRDVDDRDLRVRCATASELLGDLSAVPDLLALLRDPERSNYEIGTAALALGRIGDERAIEELAAVASDANGRPYLTRALAIVGLGLIAAADDRPPLARIAAAVNWRAPVPAITELLSIL